MTSTYEEFLATKRIFANPCGFDIKRLDINPMMLDPKHEFQADIVQWACKRGKAAVFANTGLGKGPIQLEWCRHVCIHTGGDCLIAAPLAVAQQFMREADKFGIQVTLCRKDSDVKYGINVTNYDSLDNLDLSRFAGISLDESSCIKDFNSKLFQGLIERLSKTRFKLCSSATPSPNEHAELGTHAELLDVMSRTQMLAMFFEHNGGQTSKWSLKGHGKKPFFEFLSQFCVCVSKPSDIGPYNDSAYVLPPLNLQEHIVAVDHSVNTEGMLFRCPDMSATGLHKELRLTATDRIQKAASLILDSISNSVKLSECQTGKENTKRIDAENLPATQNTPPDYGPIGRKTPEPQKKTGSTCGSTTQKTKRPNGASEHLNNEPELTLQEGIDTDLTQTIVSHTNPKSRNGRKTTQQKQKTKTSDNTDLPSSYSVNGLTPTEENVQSADFQTSEILESSRTSTIATQRESSEAYYAPTAIWGSENSKTTSPCCAEQSPTLRESWIIWCNTNYEQEPMRKALGDDCISIDGSMSPDEKERRIVAWLRGDRPILLTKPSVAGWGLNFQHCRNMIFVGMNYSFESMFQAIRRCWRFGQVRAVNAHIIMAETEGAIMSAIREKEAAYEELQREMSLAMRVEQLAQRANKSANYDHQMPMEVPVWLTAQP